MEWLHNLLDNSTTPIVSAILLGLITALSPCPLATNIAAIGYIAKQADRRRSTFINGMLYALGRIIAYSALGAILITLLHDGSSLFGIQKSIAHWGELLIGSLLVVIGLYMLFGHKLNISTPSVSGLERLTQRGYLGTFMLGMLFALAFCPTSGVLYFGMLIPMSAASSIGLLLPAVFAIGTALPVVVVAWILAFSAEKIGTTYGIMQSIRRWTNLAVGTLFIVIGLYYCSTLIF